MSRSGYTEDYEPWQGLCWRGAVSSAMYGKRGQAFLKEMLNALDNMKDKRLIADDLQRSSGEVCAIGAVGAARGLDMNDIDPDDTDTVADKFGVARALACEIVYENDEGKPWSMDKETPEHRYDRMRRWVIARLMPSSEYGDQYELEGPK